MVIREIRKSELKELLSLYEYLKSGDIPKESDELNDVWESILNYNGQHIIVAEEENKIVSSCVVTIIPFSSNIICMNGILSNFYKCSFLNIKIR